MIALDFNQLNNPYSTIITLLQGFLTYALEENEDSENWLNILSAEKSAIYINDIQNESENLPNEILKSELSAFISSVFSLEISSADDFEEKILELCSIAGTVTSRSLPQIQDGVYHSTTESMSVNATWSSTSADGIAAFRASSRKKLRQIPRITLQTEINDLPLGVRTFTSLVRRRIRTIYDLTQLNIDELKRTRNLGIKGAIETIKLLDAYGFRLRDCDVDTYPSINDCIKHNFKCKECEGTLKTENTNVEERLCGNCVARIQRTEGATTLSLDISSPEYADFTKGKGLLIYVTIINLTEKPLKLSLQECSIYRNADKRQQNSNYSYTGYAFDEEFVFPNTAKTMGRIWITENWSTANLDYDDYITVSFKDENSQRLYFYKYNYNEDDNDWTFYDYYEL